MLEGLPWETMTAATGGWVLFGIAGFMFFTGKGLVSTREANSYLKRAEKAEEANTTLIKVIAEMTAVGRLQKALITAKQQAASVLEEEQGEGSDDSNEGLSL